MSHTMPRNSMPNAHTIPNRPTQRRPHNEQSVPGDVLLALVDRLGSLAETKVAMTPTAPHCCPMVPLILHPARGVTAAKDDPFQAAGRIFRLANTVVDQRCALQHKRACPFLNPWGMSGFALEIERTEGDWTNRPSASLRLATVWVTPNHHAPTVITVGLHSGASRTNLQRENVCCSPFAVIAARCYSPLDEETLCWQS